MALEEQLLLNLVRVFLSHPHLVNFSGVAMHSLTSGLNQKKGYLLCL